MFFSGRRKVSHFLFRIKMVIRSPTSFFEDPFNNTAHYHVLKRYNFSCSQFRDHSIRGAGRTCNFHIRDFSVRVFFSEVPDAHAYPRKR